MKKIQDNLVMDVTVGDNEGMVGVERVQKPHLSPVVDIGAQEKLYGLAERIVAVESAIFLARQYEYLQDYLESLVPPANKKILQQFYSQVRFF